MASTRLALVAVVLLLATFSMTEAIRGFGPRTCCSRFIRKPMESSKVQSYVWTSQQCVRPAVIFTTAEGKVCAKPSQAWVKNIMERLDVKVGSNSNL